MNSALERLLSLHVSDAMCSVPVTVSPHETLAEAAAHLRKHDVSGAPVVDELGHCVGILTAADFLRQETEQLAAEREQPLCDRGHLVTQDCADEALHVDTVEHELVQNHMTTAVQSVTPRTMLLEAARIMSAMHVHRLPVLDAQGHVLGMISALDLVSATVQAIEE